MHHIGSIDLDTGELLQGIPVWVGVKSSPYGNRWFMAHQEALLCIAKDRELTKEAYRILMVLLGRLDFQNWIYVQQKEICNELDLKKSNVSRSIHLLEQKGILLRGPKLGRGFGYKLNPYYGWKGKASSLRSQAKLQLVKKYDSNT